MTSGHLFHLREALEHPRHFRFTPPGAPQLEARHFRDDVAQEVVEGRLDAGVGSALVDHEPVGAHAGSDLPEKTFVLHLQPVHHYLVLRAVRCAAAA